MIVKSCLYIVQHTHLMEQTDILECSGDSRLVDINGTLSGDILSVQIDDSLVRLIHTCKKVKDCSLTGTIRTDQTSPASVKKEVRRLFTSSNAIAYASFFLNLLKRRSLISIALGAQLISIITISTIA